MTEPGRGPSEIAFAYRLVPVGRLPELQTAVDALAGEGRLSENATFRGYLRELSYGPPADLPDARSVLILAVFTRLMYVRFHLGGTAHDVMMPPSYYSTGLSAEDLKAAVLERAIGEPGHVAVRANAVPLKALAVRSGLGAYGRNGICYVDGMGSFLTLHAYFTDLGCSEEHWGDAVLMPACRGCSLCVRACPCGAISAEDPVIDADKCLTLYNEDLGDFPQWIGPDAHNALVGCMRCQLCCPANREVAKRAGRLEDVTEEETRRILEGRPDAALLESLTRKLRQFVPATSEEHFPILTRNLRALLGRYVRGSVLYE